MISARPYFQYLDLFIRTESVVLELILVRALTTPSLAVKRPANILHYLNLRTQLPEDIYIKLERRINRLHTTYPIFGGRWLPEMPQLKQHQIAKGRAVSFLFSEVEAIVAAMPLTLYIEGIVRKIQNRNIPAQLMLAPLPTLAVCVHATQSGKITIKGMIDEIQKDTSRKPRRIQQWITDAIDGGYLDRTSLDLTNNGIHLLEFVRVL